MSVFAEFDMCRKFLREVGLRRQTYARARADRIGIFPLPPRIGPGSIVQMIDKRKLILRKIWTTAYALPDGGMTRDQGVALWARRVRMEPDPEAVKTAVRGLLRVDPSPSRRRATPARCAVAQELLGLGLIPAPLRSATSEAERIDDATWRAISQLSESVKPDAELVNMWTLTLTDGDDKELDLPVECNPRAEAAEQYPSETVYALLRALTDEGWSVRRLVTELDPEDGELIGREVVLWKWDAVSREGRGT